MSGAINTTADDALGDSDVTDLVERLARREVSPDELRRAVVARAEAANPTINALVGWLDESPPGDRLDWSREGPFAGVPTMIKDNEPLQGYATTHGSLATPDTPARRTSPFVRHMLQLGLVPVARTTMPEFGLSATTESTRFGATRNPWSLDHSAGGSSGGSAAMVAAGVLPMAHANDGGGSIRIPAGVCGLVGLKPTRARLIDPPEVNRLPVPMITQGVLTRSVRDTALFYAEYERLHPNPALPPIGHVTGPGSRLRMAFAPYLANNLPVSPEVVSSVEAAAKLCESLGHDVVETKVPVDDQFGVDFLRYWGLLAFLLQRSGSVVFGRGFDARRTEELTRGLSAMLGRHLDRMPATLRRLRQFAHDHEAGFRDYDVLISPVTAHATPLIGHLGPDVAYRIHLRRLLRYATATPMQSISGSPSISLPLATSDSGLPMGVQFTAAYGHERTLLELALELEAAQPWKTLPSPAERNGKNWG